MTLTPSLILRAVPQTDRRRLDEFVRVFNLWSDTFAIDTPVRAVHFLAQCFHESAALRYTEEIASGRAYEGRADLGNTRPGDGQRFKGRGFIQLTGRANYQAYADSGFCKGNLMAHPEWLAQSPGNTKASMFFWWKNSLSQIADLDTTPTTGPDILIRITRKVNGGLNGLSSRLAYYKKFSRTLLPH